MTVLDPSRHEILATSRQRFVDGLEEVRPRLHRYCHRLLGSPLDAEDVVQDVLAEAFFKAPVQDLQEGLESWLFRVAHNRSMDVIRRRLVRQRPLDPPPDQVAPADPVAAVETVQEAFGHLVRNLPPRERASLVFKDVLDYSLKETAAMLDSTEGAVKAALHRARTKLQAAADAPQPSPTAREADEEQLRLISAYAERFNSRDWNGLVSMLKADARLRVLEVFDGSGPAGFEQHYFRNYSRLRVDWTLRPIALAGEAVLLVERRVDGRPRPYSIVRVDFEESRIAGITDYLHVPGYFLEAVAREVGCRSPAGFEWAHLGGARTRPTVSRPKVSRSTVPSRCS